ncbi:hypothetical protein G6M87_10945 [Rhizobium rhizogenes]|uniref:phage tail length tape measure family protein n=1 Tax=Rhizobium rhizogenes TaxID=359 RepID=UPI001572F214|nr:phage tail length tape measure family protein [Rhizobium rhizogenes]NTI22374.1 hypothetical protein [Rhizobium rhizogenes]QTG05960.1 hypothetical protein G6M87_10945 [Rhizobium rhizogenes]
MADTDSGGLLVQIGTTQARMERELARLVSSASKSANSMEKSFTAANENIGKSADTAFGNFNRGANAAAPAVKNLGGYTANLASQLNDITVQLAGGQSPFQIMLQQGTQIGQIVQQAGGGLKTLGSILGSAFLSVLNPVNLLTFAVIGLGGAAVQYFGNIITSGNDSAKTLEEQTKLVESVAKAWGDAVPALKEYVDNLERAKNVEDLQKVVKQRQDDAKKQLQGLLSEFEASNRVDVGFLSQDANDASAPLNKLGAAYVDLKNKITAGTATAADFQKVSDEATAAGSDAVKGFSTSFSSFEGAATGALAILGKFVSQAKEALDTAAATQEKIQNISTASTFSDNGSTFRTEDFIPQGTVPTPSAAPDQTELANKALTDQTELLKKVSSAYGDVIPDLQDFIDKTQEAANVTDLKTAVDNQQISTLAETRNSLYSFNEANQQFIDLMAKASENTDDPLNKLAVAYEALREKILNGTATTEDFQKVSASMPDATSSGIDGLSDFASAFNSFAGSVQGALAILMQFKTNAASALNTAATVQSDLQNKIQGATQLNNGKIVQTPPSNVVLMDDGSYAPAPTPESRPSTEGMYPGGTWNKPKSSGGSKRGANSYKDEVASINERTAALRAGTAAQAQINPLVNDYGFALTKAQTESKLLSDAQKAGMSITPALRDQISELATGYANATVESKKLSESQKQIQKNAEEWADTSKDVFKGFLSDVKNGKSGAEALSNALNKLSDKILDMAVNSLFSTKSGSGVGTGISSLFSGIGKLFGFASGTANTGGKRGQPIGVVHGQEAVIPLPSGGKVPVQIASPIAQPSKSSRDVVSINLTDDSGRMADIANQQIHTASGTIVQVAVTKSYQQVKTNLSGMMTDAQARTG